MSDRSAFTRDEWSLHRTIPILVTAAMIAAEPSGLFGQLHEAIAGNAAMLGYAKEHPDNALVAAIAADTSIPAMPNPRELMGEGTPEEQATRFTVATMTRLHEALEILRTHATQAELHGYGEMVMHMASDVANADREGGFLGFGGQRVSENERSLLEQLAVRLGVPSPPQS